MPTKRGLKSKVIPCKFQPKTKEVIKTSILDYLKYTRGKDNYSATMLDVYTSAALAVKEHLTERWSKTQETYYKKDAKRVYYLSFEFLMGRTLMNAVINLDIRDEFEEALQELGFDIRQIEDAENDAGLGNGGLGRLAACFLDSMATRELPGYGYGIRYEYGMFAQKIINGNQAEFPDPWLHFGNPWEIERPEDIYPVHFGGHLHEYTDENGRYACRWDSAESVMAMAHDIPVPGYGNNTVNNLRLWAAKCSRGFNLDYFNHGDYIRAVSSKIRSETLSKVLYPNDDVSEGKNLRLKQGYFFVSATLQDIIRRYKNTHGNNFSLFTDKVSIQLNDTHPAIAVAELMRLLVDVEGLPWETSWDITTGVFAYTNHTMMPEALEKWPVSLITKLLPRHMRIIYEINARFLDEVRFRFPGDNDLLRRLSIIEEGAEKKVVMANLAIVGSHSVNGVSALHSNLITESLFKDFHALWPHKFNNKTNGITQRRWLKSCNPGLASLITEYIGNDWVKNLSHLESLLPYAEDAGFSSRWNQVKLDNKRLLSNIILDKTGISVDPESMFDCQIKRIHEYKRQLLNLLHAVALYGILKNDPDAVPVKRTIIFGGKAAPGYHMAKRIISLINAVAKTVNIDPDIRDMLKIVFLPNYGVSLAERIIPAADLSQQISTAGTEASGTGNMKFMLNSALTIGTLDGANIEIMEEVGRDNIFIFGKTSAEIEELKSGYSPLDIYNENDLLRSAIEMIGSGLFSDGDKSLFQPVINSLLYGDKYMLFADFADYNNVQRCVEEEFRNKTSWTKKSIINVAKSGKFSSDRTIDEYNRDIWQTKPITIPSL